MNNLFHRLLRTYLLTLVGTLALFGVSIYWFAERYVFKPWSSDLRAELLNIADELLPRMPMDQWAGVIAQSNSPDSDRRLRMYTITGLLIADSRPHGHSVNSTQDQRIAAAIGQIKPGGQAQRIGSGLRIIVGIPDSPYYLVLSKRHLHPLPQNFLLWAVLLIAVWTLLWGAILYSFSKRLANDFAGATGLADEVANGNYGRQLSVPRTAELGRLVNALNRMSIRLAQAQQLNSELIGNVSHELRSPLARIRVMAESLENRNKAADRQRTIDRICTEVETLNDLVADLLHAARLEHANEQASSLSLEETDLVEFLQQLGERFQSRLGSVTLSMQLPKKCSSVQTNQRSLNQLLGNLLDNALAAIDSASEGKISIELVEQEQCFDIHVRDNGCGIAIDDLQHIFLKFYRADASRSRVTGGVGLGLSIARQLARALAGELQVESSVGAGSCFTLSLSKSKS